MNVLKDEQYCFARHGRLHYGYDAFQEQLIPEPGYRLLADGEQLQQGDRSFDIYAGWSPIAHMYPGVYHASARGQKTGYSRKIESNG